MKTYDGNQLVKNTSSLYLLKSVPYSLEFLLLFFTGALAILFHAKFKAGISMPGHHGLVFMALLFSGKYNSRFSYAGSIMSMGMGFALLMPFLGFKDPLASLVYTIPGFVFDLIQTQKIKNTFLLIISGGLSYALIPFVRMILGLLSIIPLKGAFLKFGFVYPHISFFLFGLAGVCIAFFGTKLIRRYL